MTNLATACLSKNPTLSEVAYHLRQSHDALLDVRSIDVLDACHTRRIPVTASRISRDDIGDIWLQLMSERRA